MVFVRLGLVVGAVVGSFLALRAGIEVASKAYQEAAKQGIAVATSETINQAFKAIGMSTPNLESILPTLGKGNDTAAILNAAQGGQLGADSQQLLNMAEEFKYAMQEAAKSARQIQQTSKAGQNLSQDGSGVAREWHTLMALFMSDTYEVVHLTLSGVKKLLGWINDLYSSLILFKQMLGLTPKDGGKFTQQVTGGGTKTDTNSFEKIGFVMHGASPEKNLSDINKNTSAAVGLLTKIALAAGVISVANGANAGSVLANTIQTVNTP
jgi:hypothetical protein